MHNACDVSGKFPQEISFGNESRSRKEKIMKFLKWVFQTLAIRSQLEKKYIKQLKEETFPSCLLNKFKDQKGIKKQHHFRQRYCLPVKIRPSSATYDHDEMHSLHQQTFLRHDAWQTELSDCGYFAHYRSQKVAVW